MTCPSSSTALAPGCAPPIPQVLCYFAAGKCISYIRFCPLFSGRRDDARPFLRQREASGISEVTHTSVAPMCSAIQSSSALSPTRTMLTFDAPGGRIGREPLETTKTLTLRRAANAVDLLAHRTRISIDVNVSQVSAWFLPSPRSGAPEPPCLAHHRQSATPAASTTACVPALP